MPELRRDPAKGKWVIIAVERSSRPSDFKLEVEEPAGPEKCPFDGGKEDQTPPEITAIRPEGSNPNTPGWTVRVVPNKFPALKIEGEIENRGNGVYDAMNGVGAHEIIIETPDHFAAFETLKLDHVSKIIWMFRERYLDLRKNPRLKYILIFKNKGRRAGASLEHSHSQLIATPIMPDLVKIELEAALTYYRYRGRCVYCDIISQEINEGKRLIFENNDFIAITPYASIVPFEIQIMPKQHSSDFGDIRLAEMNSLAEALQSSLKMLAKAVPHVSYNFYLHTSPLENLTIPHYHWHIEIVPRLTHIAGFEWGSGLYINPVPPENAAKFLLEAKGVQE
jgi:UDPglucose--hexose-1-phosphate uridylyltransferase